MSTKKLVAYYAAGILGWGLVYYSLVYEPPKKTPEYFTSSYTITQILGNDTISNSKNENLENKLFVENKLE